MLILGRKDGESLLIGEDIRITIISAERGRVRLSIDAPKSVPILRSELLGAMDANQDAARDDASPLALLDLLGSVIDHSGSNQSFPLRHKDNPPN